MTAAGGHGPVCTPSSDYDGERCVEHGRLVPDRPARTETVAVTVTFPDGMYDDVPAVVREVLADPSYGLAGDHVQVSVSAPTPPAFPGLGAEEVIAAAIAQRPDPAEVVRFLVAVGWTPPPGEPVPSRPCSICGKPSALSGEAVDECYDHAFQADAPPAAGTAAP